MIIEVPDVENLDEKFEKKLINVNEKNTIERGMPSEFGQTHLSWYTRNKMFNLLLETGFKDIKENPNTSIGINTPIAFRFDCKK